MRKVIFLVLAAIGLAACTTSPIPPGYTGPVAQVANSAEQRDISSASIFTLTAVNGKDIDDSLMATRQASYGQGFVLRPVAVTREVPAQPGTFTIKGETAWAAPIQAFLNKVYRVSGTITFTPAAGETYLVRGALGPDYSAVWLEDVRTHQVIDRKIEVKGSATIGILEK